MNKKSGFTLVELLAVVVLLSAISLIITPKIGQVLKDQQRNVFEESVEGLINTVKQDAINNSSFTSTTTQFRQYSFNTNRLTLVRVGNISADENIKTNGNIKNGTGYITITNGDEISVQIYNDKFCAVKTGTDRKITITDMNKKNDCVNSEIEDEEGNSCYVYEINDNDDVVITGYNYDNPECSKDLMIPNRIGGKNVTEIAPFAFVKSDSILYVFGEGDRVDYENVYYTFDIEKIPEDMKLNYFFSFEDLDSFGLLCKLKGLNSYETISIENEYLPDNEKYDYCYISSHSDAPDNLYYNGYSFNSISFEKNKNIENIPMGMISGSTLKSINLGEKIKTIDEVAFVSNYISDITFSPVLERIEFGAFGQNEIENLDFENVAIKEIGENAFVYNESLKYIKIPSTLNKIGMNAFAESGMTTDGGTIDFTDANNLVSINDGAFSYSNYTTLILPESNSSLVTIGNGAFLSTNISCDLDFSGFEALKNIGSSAFEVSGPDYHSHLGLVTLPKSVSEIGNCAFYWGSSERDLYLIAPTDIEAGLDGLRKGTGGGTFVINGDNYNLTNFESCVCEC